MRNFELGSIKAFQMMGLGPRCALSFHVAQDQACSGTLCTVAPRAYTIYLPPHPRPPKNERAESKGICVTAARRLECPSEVPYH